MTGKSYDGITLRMLTYHSRYYPALLAFAREFEQETGATIEFDVPDTWWHLESAIDTDVASDCPRYDLFCNDLEFQYTHRQHFLPLNSFIERNGTDLDDFFQPVEQYGLHPPDEPGTIYGLPIRVRVPMVFYRTDLIQDFPTSWETYDEVLAEHTGKGRYGLGFPAGFNEMANKMFLARYRSLGGTLLSPDGEPLINSEKAVAALAMLKEQTERFTPPDVHGWDYEHAGQMFREGRIAVLESIAEATLMGIQDPVVSKVIDNWSVGLYPGGGANVFTEHQMVIFKHCKHPQAAFDFIANCTNQDNGRRILMEYGEDTARRSVWTELQSQNARPNLQPMIEALDRGVPFLPWVPQWLEMLRALWIGVPACIAGRMTVTEALDETASAWKQILDANPLNFTYRE